MMLFSYNNACASIGCYLVIRSFCEFSDTCIVFSVVLKIHPRNLKGESVIFIFIKRDTVILHRLIYVLHISLSSLSIIFCLMDATNIISFLYKSADITLYYSIHNELLLSHYRCFYVVACICSFTHLLY